MAMLGELREVAGLTGGSLAAMIAITAETLASWGRGHGQPNTRQVGQLALALGVTPAAGPPLNIPICRPWATPMHSPPESSSKAVECVPLT